MNNVLKPKWYHFLLLIVPGVIWYLCIVYVPVLGAGYYSLFNWKGGPKKTFIGLENYISLLNDNTFWSSFGNNLKLVCICIVGQIGIAFVLALLLNSKLTKMKQLHRVVAYFPAVLSAVVIGFIWNIIYDYNYGLLNSILKLFGKEEWCQAWLSNRSLALILVAIPLIWQFIGYYLVIIMAGLSGIDTSVLEMAEIDGATGLQRARYITLPLIKNTLIVCMTLCIAGNMKTFDHIYVMTGGGPGTTTMVMSLYSYQTSFTRYKMGYGSAISIGILVLSLVVTLISRRIAEGKGEKE